MRKFGVTKDGFKRKTYNDILEDLQIKAKEAYGENINLSNASFLGMHLQNEAWELSELWELAEDIYHSSFVDSAEGISLDNTGKYITISRKSAQKSKGIITIVANDGTRIPKGFRVGTQELDIIYETTRSVEVDELGEVAIPIISIEEGIIQNVPPNTLTKVVNPISGIEEVYNADITVDGTDAESDKEFRERYFRSIARGGSSTREAVEATLLDMENVTDAFVEENETMEYLDDIPPKSLAPYVFGGIDSEIAQTILGTKSGGIRSYGETEVTVTDSKGREQVIGFTRPIVQDVYINAKVTTDKGYVGDEAVTRAILNYIGGEDEDGIAYKGLKLGQNVIISKLLASAMVLEGIKDIEVEISTDGAVYQDTNLEIAKKEIAKTKYNKVVVSHV